MAERPQLNLIANAEQKMLAETARKLIEEKAPVARLRELRKPDHPKGFSRALYSEMAELGWTALLIPEAYEGLGLGLFDLACVLESLGRELAPEPVHTSALLGAYPILAGQSEELKQRFLPGIASGDAIVTLAYEESGLRDYFDRPSTSISAYNAGYVLNGTKIQVADALVADAFIVTCRSAATDSLAMVLVEANSDGVSIERQQRVDSRAVGIVTFENVDVAEDEVLSLEAGPLFNKTLDHAAVGLAAEMLGAAEAAFEETLAYLKERVQFDVPIGSFQALQHRAATLYCELELLRSAVYGAAAAADQAPEALPRLAALAKARANETFLHVAKEAIQMHGGIGMTDECDIGFYLKRAQAAAWSLGNTSYYRRRWAELNGY